MGYVFSGLNPARTYTFTGSTVRGGPVNSSDYSNRWTQVELVGAISATPAHSAGVITSNQYPDYLSGNQAAWNVGYNNSAASGDVISWSNIVPAPDGTFTVVCRKYTGLEPNGDASTGVRCYAFAAIKLASTPFGIGAQPQSLTVAPGETATFSVSAFGAPPLFFQWLKDGVNIPDATNQTYSIPNADMPDQGAYSVLFSNLTASVLSSDATLVVGYYPIVLTNPPQDQIVAQGVSVSFSVGFSGASPYQIQWYKDGAPIVGATNQTLNLPNVTLADMAPYYVAVSNQFSGATSSNAVLAVFSGSAPGTTLLRFADPWRFNQSGADPGVTWTDRAYDDSAWPSGQGVLARSSFSVPEPLRTTLSLTDGAGLSVTSYYFRAHFTPPFATTNVFLLASNLLDDGAVFYLNGAELARLRMASGPVTTATLASNAPNNGTTYEMLSLPSGAMLPGDNVLAVEVHQAAPTGSDAVFGMSLTAMAKDSEMARITKPPADLTVNDGESVLLTAEVFGTPPFSLQWYKDGQALPGATSLSLSFPIAHAPNGGVYTLAVSNRFSSTQSSGALVTVIHDMIAPSITSVLANDLTTLLVTFSEPVDPGSAVNPASYAFNPSLAIVRIQFLNATSVWMTTAPRDAQFDYTLAANGVRDFTIPPNVSAGDHPVAIQRRNRKTSGGLAGVQTVFLIIFENMNWSSVKGSSSAPYINSLLPQASYCENYYGHNSQHPSEPNYIFMEAGDNFGFTDDAGPAFDRLTSTNHLVTLLNNAMIDWRGYMESMPPGSTGTADSLPLYVGRHNPFAFFNDVTTDYNYATNHIRPYSYFANDLANGQIGRYNWITPNIYNDMHDRAPGSPSALAGGDTWLAGELPRILSSPAFTNNGAVFLTFDENAFNASSPIMMVVLSPLAKGGGYASTTFYDHSSYVRTMQDIFGVEPYLGDAVNATNLGELFSNPRITASRVNGIASVTLSDIAVGKIHYLQASSDMLHWTTIRTVSADTPGQTITVSDPDSGSYRQRFYRIAVGP